jgi:hypothetical protein
VRRAILIGQLCIACGTRTDADDLVTPVDARVAAPE